MSRNPTMPEIRAAMDQARGLAGREDTERFSLEAPALLARLVQYLDLYVGHEPTLAEEEEYVRQQQGAADPFEADLDGWLRCGRPRCPNAERFGKAAERGWVMHPAHIWLCPRHAEQPAPDFFRPGLTYVRQYHGEYILFTVASVATGPGHTYPTAFGWRKAPGEDWEPTDSDDMDGWTLLDEPASTRGTAAGGA